MRVNSWLGVTILGATLMSTIEAPTQGGSVAPPAVGVVTAEFRPMAETTEINGRIQAIQRVDLVPRVTAFLNERLFTEGAEVKKGDILYQLEKPPFEAAVEAKQAAVAQARAQLENANLTLTRAQNLLQSSSGTQVAVDNALATQRTTAAEVLAAQAQLHQSQINLDYTEIKAPIDGRIGRTSVTVGNVVSPTSGTLATVVSADPVYVVFPVAMRRVLEFRDRYADNGGFDAVKIRIKLPNGKMYDQSGKLDFIDIGVAKDTDTITLRATIANPVLQGAGAIKLHELTDDEFVTVSLEAVQPLKVLAVPRAALLSDQQGDYVYVVNAQNIAEQRRVKLGQSTAEIAAVTEGLKEGDKVVAEGIQRVRPGLTVAPAPASSISIGR